jgi:pimeloyl-ACP methyl ester carboxylesterase
MEFLTLQTPSPERRIAVEARAATSNPDAPTLVWLGGYRSDMDGTKAIELDRFAADNGIGCVRFDYSGHGKSSGDYRDGTISLWVEEAMAVIDTYIKGRMILVGSSLGGWVTLRVVEEMEKRGDAARLAGLVLIAPAPDFTHELIEPALTEAERTSLAERGYFEEPSEYSTDPNVFTRALIEDGRQNRVLDGIIETGCPVHILQGMQDPDVPYSHALKLLNHLPADDVVMTLIRDGDHRLSRPQDIERMLAAVEGMVAE